MQPTPAWAVFTEAVRFKKLDDRALTPKFQTPGAAGFDLATIDQVTVPARRFTMARTGLVIAAPPRHMLMLVPRSSTWSKWEVRLANTVGIIDTDYCGDEDELLLALWNPTINTAIIPEGTRIAQGIFVPVKTTVVFQEQEEMGTSRGGWGSTG